MRCWAHRIGGCSSKQSKEHYITEGLWKSRSITIKGFDWLGDEEKTLPLPSLTSKILCTTHNSRLSPLDAEAIRIFNVLDEIKRLNDVRTKLKPTKFWHVKRYSANGNLFERWAAKTAIGVLCATNKDLEWHQFRTPIVDPPQQILNAVFGCLGFVPPLGLYVAIKDGDQHDFPDAVNLAPLFHPDGGFVGANLEFKQMRFLIWLDNTSPTIFNIEVGGTLFGPDGEELMYRLKEMRFEIRKVLSQAFKLEWA